MAMCYIRCWWRWRWDIRYKTRSNRSDPRLIYRHETDSCPVAQLTWAPAQMLPQGRWQVHLIVLHHKLIMRSVRLSKARCMISEPAEWGRPSVKDQSRPEKIEGFNIPIARHQAWYWLSLGEVMSMWRFSWYSSCEGIGYWKILHINIPMCATGDIVIQWLQEGTEVMLPLMLTMPMHTSV